MKTGDIPPRNIVISIRFIAVEWISPLVSHLRSVMPSQIAKLWGHITPGCGRQIESNRTSYYGL